MSDVKRRSRVKSSFHFVRMCAVPQCRNKSGDKGISFHRFPQNIKLRDKWVEILSIKRTLSSSSTACSEHFLPQDFILQRPGYVRRRLKSIAVPSQKLPVRRRNLLCPAKEKAFKRNKRASRRACLQKNGSPTIKKKKERVEDVVEALLQLSSPVCKEYAATTTQKEPCVQVAHQPPNTPKTVFVRLRSDNDLNAVELSALPFPHT